MLSALAEMFRLINFVVTLRLIGFGYCVAGVVRGSSIYLDGD